MIFAVQLRMNNDLVSSYADCQRRASRKGPMKSAHSARVSRSGAN